MAYVVHNMRAKREPISMPIYGYARVSTDGQTLDAQVAQLKAAGAEKVFREKMSGARADADEGIGTCKRGAFRPRRAAGNWPDGSVDLWDYDAEENGLRERLFAG